MTYMYKSENFSYGLTSINVSSELYIPERSYTLFVCFIFLPFMKYI